MQQDDTGSFLYPWQEEVIERLMTDKPIVFFPVNRRDYGKLSPFRHMTEQLNRMGSALKRSQSALGGLRASFVILDELDTVRAFERVPMPKKKRDWRPQEQTPPVAVEQKVRAPGVVLMRDRTGKLVERKL